MNSPSFPRVRPRSLVSWQQVRDRVTADPLMHVGARIAEIRIAMRLTQRQLATRIGAGETALAGWEQGRAEPWPIYLYRLGQTFGCSMDDLYAAGASWKPYPLPPHRSDATPCRGVQTAERYRGQPCKRWTRSETGRCPWHAAQSLTEVLEAV